MVENCLSAIHAVVGWNLQNLLKYLNRHVNYNRNKSGTFFLNTVDNSLLLCHKPRYPLISVSQLAVAQWQGVGLAIQESRVRGPAATLLRNNLSQVVHTLLPLSPSSITLPSSCISGLLPPLRDSTITSRLRTPSLYPRPATRTKRYTSFIHHALLNYQ